MFTNDRANTLPGVVLLAWVVLSILTFVLPVTDANPLQRGEIEGMLRDISDHQAWFIAVAVLEAVTNGAVMIGAGALLYILFRDRSHRLALFGISGLLAAGVMYAIYVAGNLTLALLADDFVKGGGPGGIPAGTPEIIEIARAVAVFGAMAWLTAGVAFSLGLMAFGAVLASEPQEEIAGPPRWLGALVIVSALLVIAHIAALNNELALELLFMIGYLGILVTFAVLGTWLLRHPGRERELGEQDVPTPRRVVPEQRAGSGGRA